MRRGWWFPLLVALVVIGWVVAEFAVIIQVAEWIGLWPTVLITIGTSVLGLWLANVEGRKAWNDLAASMRTGSMPSGKLADGALILLGGMLLFIPGFISDAFGLLLLTPWTRPIVRSAIGSAVGRIVKPVQRTTIIEGEVVVEPTPEPPSDPTVIRGELED